MIVSMATTARPQQRDDYRLRDLVQRTGTGDVTVATDLGVPCSTARGWLLDEHGFGYDSTPGAGTGESGDGRQQMEKQHGQIAHGTILTSSRNPRNVEQFINSP